jgi:transcriptional regulator with XRE-family HTH domain
MEGREDTTQLGEDVRRTRQERGFSLRGLAAAAGVDATWLMRLERGEYTSPDPRNLRELARVLEVETSSLFLAAGYTSGEELPGFAPYLRAKYDLPTEAVEQLAGYFNFVQQRYQPGEGGNHGRDHR